METGEICALCLCTLLDIATLSAAIVLNKDFSREYIRISSVPKIEECPKHEINKTNLKKEVRQIIEEFSNTLSQNKINLSGFYRDINSSKIIYISGAEGYYDSTEKHLIVDPDRIRESLLRALLEMSSTRTFQKSNNELTSVSGFERQEYNSLSEKVDHIGYGLSQGYKDILLERYFGIKGRYSIISELTTLIEDIVGKKTMTDCFIIGDLATVVSSLSKSHADYREAVLSLLRMDNLYDAMYLDDPFRKITMCFTYRILVINLSKQAIDKARDYYNQSKNILEIVDASGKKVKGSIVEEILNHVKSILQNRKKRPLLLGIKTNDVKEIVEHSQRQFNNLPKKYHLNN